MRMRLIARILLAVALGGCASTRSIPVVNNSLIDGWSVDTTQPAGCANDCSMYVDKVTAQFDLDAPGHAAVVSATVYREGLYPQTDGKLVNIIRSGGPFTVVVLRLADGSIAALGIQGFGQGRFWVLRNGPRAAP